MTQVPNWEKEFDEKFSPTERRGDITYDITEEIISFIKQVEQQATQRANKRVLVLIDANRATTSGDKLKDAIGEHLNIFLDHLKAEINKE